MANVPTYQIYWYICKKKRDMIGHLHIPELGEGWHNTYEKKSGVDIMRLENPSLNLYIEIDLNARTLCAWRKSEGKVICLERFGSSMTFSDALAMTKNIARDEKNRSKCSSISR